MAIKHFIADLGDGRLAHRSSQSKVYSHAVLGQNPDRDGGQWHALSWASRLDLAQKKCGKEYTSSWPNQRVVEAREVDRKDLAWAKGGEAQLKEDLA